jgi:biopolymer transport protein ExbD
VKGLQQDDEFGIVAEINMVPLIDVALVLLIIFMVMTPILIQSQIKVNLPEAGASESTTARARRFACW